MSDCVKAVHSVTLRGLTGYDMFSLYIHLIQVRFPW